MIKLAEKCAIGGKQRVKDGVVVSPGRLLRQPASPLAQPLSVVFTLRDELGSLGGAVKQRQRGSSSLNDAAD